MALHGSDQPGAAILVSTSCEVGYSLINLLFIVLAAVVRGTKSCLERVLLPLALRWISIILSELLRQLSPYRSIQWLFVLFEWAESSCEINLAKRLS